MDIWDSIRVMFSEHNCKQRIIYQTNHVTIDGIDATIKDIVLKVGKVEYKKELLTEASAQLKQIDDTDYRLCCEIAQLGVEVKHNEKLNDLLKDLYRFRAAIIVNNDNICNLTRLYKEDPKTNEDAISKAIEISRELTGSMEKIILDPISNKNRHKGLSIAQAGLEAIKKIVTRSYTESFQPTEKISEDKVNECLKPLYPLT